MLLVNLIKKDLTVAEPARSFEALYFGLFSGAFDIHGEYALFAAQRQRGAFRFWS